MTKIGDKINTGNAARGVKVLWVVDEPESLSYAMSREFMSLPLPQGGNNGS